MGVRLWMQTFQKGELGWDGCSGEGEDAEGHQEETGGGDKVCEGDVKVAIT